MHWLRVFFRALVSLPGIKKSSLNLVLMNVLPDPTFLVKCCERVWLEHFVKGIKK